MTTPLDDSLLPAVLSLLSTLGKTLTYRVRSASGGYDPTTGGSTGGAPVEHAVKSLPPYLASDVVGSSDLIRKSERATGIAGSGAPFTPREGIEVDIDGERFVVEAVEPVYSGEQVALWVMGLKRGGSRAR